jgi:hypothetical protein
LATLAALALAPQIELLAGFIAGVSLADGATGVVLAMGRRLL